MAHYISDKIGVDDLSIHNHHHNHPKLEHSDDTLKKENIEVDGDGDGDGGAEADAELDAQNSIMVDDEQVFNDDSFDDSQASEAQNLEHKTTSDNNDLNINPPNEVTMKEEEDFLNNYESQDECQGDIEGEENNNFNNIDESNIDNVNDEKDDQNTEIKDDPNVWTLPNDSKVCTLDEIRRGQAINKVASNECPVLGCGKKINENRLMPSPGTISSGLRTHVLFVHYANRKVSKKRKLGWSVKRRQPSPRKQAIGTQLSSSSMHLSPSTSGSRDPFEKHVFEQQQHLQQQQPPPSSTSNINSSLGMMQKRISSSSASTSLLNSNHTNSSAKPGSLLNQKVRQLASKSQASQQMSSLQSLMQATGASAKISPQQLPAQTKQQKTQNSNQKNTNTTSSLFSILAGLSQKQIQQQQLNNQSQNSRNMKTAQGQNTINISQCSKNQVGTNTNRPINSSLLSLLNEKISGNVAASLQTQLNKTLGATDLLSKIQTTSSSRQNTNPSSALSLSTYYQHNANMNESTNNYSNGSPSILNNICSSGNDDIRSHSSSLSFDNSMPICSFVETIAMKTGANIGPAGIAEVKKIIEKFTTSLICSSQTIADHYLAPYGGEVPKQKAEISPSDVLLAYKMMK